MPLHLSVKWRSPVKMKASPVIVSESEATNMAHWELRILSEVVGDGTEYFVSEVCYDKDGNVKSWTDQEQLGELFVQHDLDDLRGCDLADA